MCFQTLGKLWISNRTELDEKAAHMASVPLPSTGIVWGKEKCDYIGRCGCLPSELVKNGEGEGVMGSCSC